MSRDLFTWYGISVTMMCSRSLPTCSMAARARIFNWPRPVRESIQDSLPPQDEAAGREVRPGHHFQNLFEVAYADRVSVRWRR